MKDYCWDHLLEVYKSHVKQNFEVLEIGASTKNKTADLSRYCKHIIGVEYLTERLPKDFGNVNYIQGDWQELTKKIRPESIDLAISSHVIEHIPNDLKALNELYAVLKPNSFAIFNTPNRKRLPRKIIEIFTSERKFPYWEHIREYIESDLIELISKSKFKKYEINPLVLGVHTGKFNFFLKKVPRHFRGLANFWEVTLYK